MHLLLGLGNPGGRYVHTRHNVGFDAVERLAQRWRLGAERNVMGALVQDGAMGQERVVVARPQSFMNLSGGPAQALAGFYKVALSDTIVVHDELDLPVGRVKIKVGGGHGGHNGLRDISARMGANYVRIRIGIGRPPTGWDPANYVLSRPAGDDAIAVDQALDLACEAAESILKDGAERAMNRFNTETQP